MMRFFRRLRAPLRPPERVATPEARDESEQLRRLRDRIDEIERHGWELQHHINVLREEIARGKEANGLAAREACRAEIDVFRRDFDATLKTAYGALGANFRRLRIPAISDSLVGRFGSAEAMRRDEDEGAKAEP